MNLGKAFLEYEIKHKKWLPVYRKQLKSLAGHLELFIAADPFLLHSLREALISSNFTICTK
jgi:hypothetical protein